MKNKRGQDLSIGTLILIVLGIIVLVLLILGFSIGWGNLWEKINIFGGGSSIGDVVTACNLAITSQNTYDFCQNFRKIKVDSKTEYVNCEDDRVQSGLQGTNLACGTPPEGANWANWYCIQLNFNNKIKVGETLTINNGESNGGFNCIKV